MNATRPAASAILTDAEKADMMARSHALHNFWMESLLPQLRAEALTDFGRSLTSDEEALIWRGVHLAFEAGWQRQLNLL